jgi:hypothetical protein
VRSSYKWGACGKKKAEYWPWRWLSEEISDFYYKNMGNEWPLGCSPMLVIEDGKLQLYLCASENEAHLLFPPWSLPSLQSACFLSGLQFDRRNGWLSRKKYNVLSCHYFLRMQCHSWLGFRGSELAPGRGKKVKLQDWYNWELPERASFSPAHSAGQAQIHLLTEGAAVVLWLPYSPLSLKYPDERQGQVLYGWQT